MAPRMTAATCTSQAKPTAPKETAAGTPARGDRPPGRRRREGGSPTAIAAQAAAEAVVESLVATPSYPLDPGDRTAMESAFGESFADVRVHRDGQAGDFAAGLQADAFTLGQH